MHKVTSHTSTHIDKHLCQQHTANSTHQTISIIYLSISNQCLMHHFSMNKLHCLTNTLMCFVACWHHSLGVLPSSLNMVSKNLTPTVTHYTETSGPLLKANLNSSLAYHHIEHSVMYEAIYKNFTTSNISYTCNTSVSVTNQCNHIQYYIMDTPLSKCRPMVTKYTSTTSYIFN